MDLAASVQEVTEEIVLRLTRSARGRNRQPQSVPRRRRGAQLRRQRQGAARRQVRADLDSAGGGRRRRRGRCSACRLASVPRQEARRVDGAHDGRMAGSYLGPDFRAGGHRGAAVGRRRGLHVSVGDDDVHRDHGRRRSSTARRSAGSRAAWNSARARSAAARSSAIRARPACRRCST